MAEFNLFTTVIRLAGAAGMRYFQSREPLHDLVVGPFFSWCAFYYGDVGASARVRRAEIRSGVAGNCGGAVALLLWGDVLDSASSLRAALTAAAGSSLGPDAGHSCPSRAMG